MNASCCRFHRGWKDRNCASPGDRGKKSTVPGRPRMTGQHCGPKHLGWFFGNAIRHRILDCRGEGVGATILADIMLIVAIWPGMPFIGCASSPFRRHAMFHSLGSGHISRFLDDPIFRLSHNHLVNDPSSHGNAVVQTRGQTTSANAVSAQSAHAIILHNRRTGSGTRHKARGPHERRPFANLKHLEQTAYCHCRRIGRRRRSRRLIECHVHMVQSPDCAIAGLILSPTNVCAIMLSARQSTSRVVKATRKKFTAQSKKLAMRTTAEVRVDRNIGKILVVAMPLSFVIISNPALRNGLRKSAARGRF